MGVLLLDDRFLLAISAGEVENTSCTTLDPSQRERPATESNRWRGRASRDRGRLLKLSASAVMLIWIFYATTARNDGVASASAPICR